MSTKIQIAVRLHEDTIKELDQAAGQMRLSRTAVLQIALNEFFDRRKEQHETGIQK